MNSRWQQIELQIDHTSEAEQRATWLELFYDLVFVVAISQLAHNLNQDVSLSGFFGFVLLFLPVWLAWIGVTLYANRFDTDDIEHRLLTAIQMVGIAALAVNIHHGLSDTSTDFALSYLSVRAVLIFEYLRVGSGSTSITLVVQQLRRLVLAVTSELSNLGVRAPTARY